MKVRNLELICWISHFPIIGSALLPELIHVKCFTWSNFYSPNGYTFDHFLTRLILRFFYFTNTPVLVYYSMFGVLHVLYKSVMDVSPWCYKWVDGWREVRRSNDKIILGLLSAFSTSW